MIQRSTIASSAPIVVLAMRNDVAAGVPTTATGTAFFITGVTTGQSICAGSGGPDAGGQGQDVIPDGGDACAGDGKQGGDCGCAVVGGPGSAAGTGGLLTGLALAALALWRLRG